MQLVGARRFLMAPKPRAGGYRQNAARCALSFCVVCLLAASMVPAQAREIVLNASLWPPYVDPKLPGEGLAASIVTSAFRRAGYEPRVEFGDWERTLERARSGESPIVVSAWRSPERIEDFLFTDAYLENHIRFLKRRGTGPEFESLDDLDGLQIGVVYEYVYEPGFDGADNFTRAPETHIVPVLIELLDGNIDLAVDDERTLHYELSRHFSDRKADLEFLPRPLTTRHLHVAISRAHPDHEKLAADFNQGLAEIREDGTYRKLMRQANEEIWKRSYLGGASGKGAGSGEPSSR